MSIGILLLLFFLFLFLIMLGSIWFVNFLTKQHIGRKHHDLEVIANQNRIPEYWLQPFEHKIERLQMNGGNEKKIAKARQKADRECIRKFNQLIQYVKKTRLVEDEETRNMLLGRLRKLLQQKEKGL